MIMQMIMQIIRPGGSRSASNVLRHTITGSQTHYEIKNIGTQSFYEIWLTASNKAGIGDKSKVLHYSHSSTGKFNQFIINSRSIQSMIISMQVRRLSAHLVGS